MQDTTFIVTYAPKSEEDLRQHSMMVSRDAGNSLLRGVKIGLEYRLDHLYEQGWNGNVPELVEHGRNLPNISELIVTIRSKSQNGKYPSNEGSRMVHLQEGGRATVDIEQESFGSLYMRGLPPCLVISDHHVTGTPPDLALLLDGIEEKVYGERPLKEHGVIKQAFMAHSWDDAARVVQQIERGRLYGMDITTMGMSDRTTTPDGAAEMTRLFAAAMNVPLVYCASHIGQGTAPGQLNVYQTVIGARLLLDRFKVDDWDIPHLQGEDLKAVWPAVKLKVWGNDNDILD